MNEKRTSVTLQTPWEQRMHAAHNRLNVKLAGLAKEIQEKSKEEKTGFSIERIFPTDIDAGLADDFFSIIKSGNGRKYLERIIAELRRPVLLTVDYKISERGKIDLRLDVAVRAVIEYPRLHPGLQGTADRMRRDALVIEHELDKDITGRWYRSYDTELPPLRSEHQKEATERIMNSLVTSPGYLALKQRLEELKTRGVITEFTFTPLEFIPGKPIRIPLIIWHKGETQKTLP